jgi:hypothetical protein
VGKIVETKEEAFGEKSKYLMQHPEYCVYVDETGLTRTRRTIAILGAEDLSFQGARPR